MLLILNLFVLRYSHFTGSAKLDDMVEGDVALNAHLDFLGFLKAIGAFHGTVQAASDNHLNITTNHTSCYGGCAQCPQTPAEFDKW